VLLAGQQPPPPPRSWLGYAAGLLFPGAPVVTFYARWAYVLVEAGPRQASSLGKDRTGASWQLPALMFPADRSWLVSALWDDDWICVGGPARLADLLLGLPRTGGTAFRRADSRAAPSAA